MTHISPSRGFMYSDLPTEEKRDERTREEGADRDVREDDEDAHESPAAEPVLDPDSVSSGSDANWTGNVPADD